MYLPPPVRKDPPRRPRKESREESVEDLSFQDRTSGVTDNWQRTKAVLRERLEIERNHVQAELRQQELARQDVSAMAESDERQQPRNLIEERSNPDGSTTRRYSDGAELTRLASGDVVGKLGNGQDYFSDSLLIRTNNGEKACVLQ